MLVTVTALGLVSASATPGLADGGRPGSKTTTPVNPFPGPVGGELLGRMGKPVVNLTAGVPPLPKVNAAAFLIADMDTGEVLAAKNAHKRLRPASTLKALTAITLLPRLDKRARYTAQRVDADMIGSKVGIEAGKVYTIDQLFYGLFLPSGNDAAMALANASGGLEATTKLMNAEAERIGAFDTHAVTPEGLDEPGQLSSAYDLALIGREGMSRSDFAHYCSTTTYDFPGRGKSTYQIQNTNRLLYRYDGAIGIKNGYTSKAGNTLIAAAERDGRTLIVTALDADPLYEQVAELLDWGFTAAGKVQPIGELVTPEDVEAARDALRPERVRASQTEDGSDTDATLTPDALPDGPRASGTTGANLATTRVGGLPLWLWAAALLFVVMAGARIFSHVRSRPEPPTGQRSGPHG